MPSRPLELLRGGVHLGRLTRVLADAYGERPAVTDPAPTPGVHPGGTRSFAEIEYAVARHAAAFAGLGLAGRTVLVALENRIDVVIHALALSRAGAIPVPVNARLKKGEFAAVVTASGATAVVADPDGPVLAKKVERVTTDDLVAWFEGHPDAELPPSTDGDPDAVALMLTTSGTTGNPKAAALTSRGLLGGVGLLSLVPVGNQGGFRGGRDRMLACLPLTHVMGFSTTLAAWAAGVPLLRRPTFAADEILDLIESERPNVLVGVPTMYADLEAAGAAERDLSSIQLFISAADVLPLDRARRFQRFGAAGRIAGRAVGNAAFLDIYGMVELSGAAALRVLLPTPIGTLPAPAFAVSLPGFSVRAVDGFGDPLGFGQTGELQFRGPGVLQHYEGRPDAGPDDDGWLATGDHGQVLPGGLFRFAGRSHDRLKIAGFSVFPAEVETELRAGPGLVDVAVVGLEDERLGQRPVAVVVPGPDFDAEVFLAWARDAVAGYRRPHEVVVVDTLPRGNNGKLDRAAATRLAEQAT